MQQKDDLECVLQTEPRTVLGEGPCWDAKKQILYWVYIRGLKLNIYHPDTKKNDVIQLDKMIGCVVKRESGGVVVALQNGLHWIDTDNNKTDLHFLADPEHHLPKNRFNDGKVDPRGRLWAGTLEIEEKNGPLGALYRFDKDLSSKKMLDQVEISNGLAWSPDHKTMYFIDSPRVRVDAFDYNVETGDISNKRTLINITDGSYPDGMTIDKEGCLWVAHWNGSKVTRWDPSGKLLRTVPLPVSKVTSCCFGGPKLDQLYITSASWEIDVKKEPLAGGLFILKNPGVTGFEEKEFEG